MHGFAPAILHAVPLDRAASLDEIQASVAKTPGRSSLTKHLSAFVRQGLVVRDGPGLYRRLALLDSELDAEVSA